MLGWLLLAALGIIWIAFLVPWKRSDRSPRSTVADFERRMAMLEETNKTSSGRYVLMPRKGERFRGTEERARLRVKQRRRAVFKGLLEATGGAVLIGLFPPLRAFLVIAVVLALALAGYCALLVKLRADEQEFARRRAELGLPARRRSRVAAAASFRPRSREEQLMEAFEAAGLRVAGLDGSTDAFEADVHDLVWSDELAIVEDDVHVVVRRAGDVRRAAGAGGR